MACQFAPISVVSLTEIYNQGAILRFLGIREVI
jgi:hypothetical protein